ncbi:NAD-dependent protein deacylase [uncultured Sphaerochaeta sp.]|uniref:NAD-dependent protein deacylase n=1 Tax=uncultured Sphaerochaeta sp. TaxID=886478 RepID=UPI002A0A5A2E|nr:NAD-dependent protein deacylase [uncultured Sphaerochaeta sp.]
MSDNHENSIVFERKIERLKTLILKSNSMVVFTGAGVSTLSGIPDFRGKNGLYTDQWHSMPVEEILSISFFDKHPELFYQWAKDVWYHLEDYQPNIVHTTLASMEAKGYVKGLYTQNIDMLHRRAGSKNVYEVHGSAKNHHCRNCNKYFDYIEIADKVRDGIVPRCDQCGGIIKPDIVFYGENLDSFILERAYQQFSTTDLCLVLGSSLSVQPAASFPYYATRNGAPLVIVNAQETNQDTVATLRFSDLEQTFKALSSWFETVEPKNN